MAEIRFLLLTTDGRSLGDLVAAGNRKMEFNLAGPSTVTFDLPGDHPDAGLITELACDLLVVRDQVPMFRGRVGTSTDTLAADAHTCTFSAIDYRGMLDRRILWDDSLLSFRGLDQSVIAYYMIVDSQDRPGGNLGITAGTGFPTGHLVDRDFQAGAKLGESIDSMAQMAGGFEWDIDPLLRLNIYYPTRGRPGPGVDLVYGQQIAAVTRNQDSTSYATALRYSGKSPPTEPVAESLAAFPPPGRWEAQTGNPDAALQTTVQALADAALEASSVLVANYSLVLFDGWWTPTDLWLGDVASLFISSGRLDIAGDQFRVIGLKIDYSDDGAETVTVALGDVPPSMTSRLTDYQDRIEVLERQLTAPAGWALDAPVGAVYLWPGSTVPQMWMACDGSFLEIALYPELYAVLGMTFGSAYGLYLALPDLRSKVPVGAGQGIDVLGHPLSSYQVGQAGGSEAVWLDGTQLPTHWHTTDVSGSTDIDYPSHMHGSLAYGTSWTGGESAAHSHLLGGKTGNDWPAHDHDMGLSLQPNMALGNATVMAPVPPGQHTAAPNIAHQHDLPAYVGANDSGHIHSIGPESNSHGHGFTAKAQVSSVAGSGAAHTNIQPFLALSYIIRVLPPWRPTPT